MNFFEAQAVARRNTLYVLILYVFCIAILIYLAYWAVYIFDFNFSRRYQTDESWLPSDIIPPINVELFTYISVGMFFCIMVCSLARWIQLSQGGEVVANSMGGRLICLHTKNPDERRLLNIVEEMSIASGVPMPSVYSIYDPSINAFAAGTTINNAVIGVTTGAMQAFTRDEMQAVIAHEFSHILNGDMRMNIRMIGITFGLSVLGIIGALLLRSSLYSSIGSRHRNNNAMPLIVAGLILCIIGYAGVFFTNLMRMVISRQREYLADASAVQFTRSQSIASALDRIANYSSNNAIERPNASEFSHMFFSDGMRSSLHNLFATHPPLKSRILRVMPEWDGSSAIAVLQPLKDGQAKQTTQSQPLPTSSISSFASENPTTDKMQRVNQLTDHIGCLTITQHAQDTIKQYTDSHILDALEDSYSARALIYAFLINQNHQAYHGEQLQHLQQHADSGVYDMVVHLLPTTVNIKPNDQLNLVKMAIMPLRTLSQKQYERFLDNIAHLTIMDDSICFFEWSLQAIVVHALNDTFYPKARLPNATNDDMAYALSILIRSDKNVVPEQIFQETVTALSLPLQYVSTQFNSQQLFNSMQRLSKLPPHKKQAIVRAFIYAVVHNQTIEEKEEVLLRAYLALLDCPFPQDFNNEQN